MSTKTVENGEIVVRTTDEKVAIEEQRILIQGLRAEKKRIARRIDNLTERKAALVAERDELNAQIDAEQLILDEVTS